MTVIQWIGLIWIYYFMCLFYISSIAKAWTLLLFDVFGPLEERQQWRLWSIDIWMDEWRDGWVTGIEWGCWDPPAAGSVPARTRGGERAGRATWCLVSLFQVRGWHHRSALDPRRRGRAWKRLSHKWGCAAENYKGTKATSLHRPNSKSSGSEYSQIPPTRRDTPRHVFHRRDEKFI